MVGQEIRNEDGVHLTNANWTLVGWLEWLVVWCPQVCVFSSLPNSSNCQRSFTAARRADGD